MKHWYWIGLGLAGLGVPLGAGAQALPPAPVPASRLAPARVQFGVKVGFNYANTNFNQGVPKPVVPVETTWQAGFQAGGLLVVPLPGRLALQQEYLFSQLGGAIRGGPRYTLRYLSLPLLLSYEVLPRLRLVAGPQFDLLLQARQETGGQTTDITHDTEERSFGAVAGVAVRLGARLHLGARYVQGLNHVGIGQRSAGVQEFKYEVVQLSADVRF